MIPKKLYYIWLGNEKKPDIFYKCLSSWKKNLPDYEIIELNEENTDIELLLKQNKFFRECYERKIWAFVSDYIRTYYLHKYGGIYVDIDMEIIKDFSVLLHKNTNFFAGYEDEKYVSCGILGATKNHPVLNRMLVFYEKEIWDKPIYTIPKILTYILESDFGLTQSRETSLENGSVRLFEKYYFYPFGYRESFSKDCITDKTYGIHWWNDSWGNVENYIFLRGKHIKKPFKKIFNLIIRSKYFLKNLFSLY